MDRPIKVSELIKVLQKMPFEAAVCKRNNGGNLMHLTTVYLVSEIKPFRDSKDFVFMDFNESSNVNKNELEENDYGRKDARQG